MDSIDNNQFEVKQANSKRKIITPCPNVYLNPALDLLANEDPICNTAMEIIPNKKRKRAKSCDVISFENTALDSGLRKATNEFLVRELENVKRNVKIDLVHEEKEVNVPTVFNFSANDVESINLTNLPENVTDLPENVTDLPENVTNLPENVTDLPENLTTEPIYANLTDLQAETVNPIITTEIDLTKPYINNSFNISDISKIQHEDFDSGISVLEPGTEQAKIINVTNIQTNVTNQTVFNNSTNLSLSFIERLALDSPNISDKSLILDDDLNESNIMEIKTITIITKKKRIIEKKNTNPFLDPNLDVKDIDVSNNPFLNTESENYNLDTINSEINENSPNDNVLVPRRLFGDTNSTISNESIESQHEYENINRPESPIYENIDELNNFNKQSKVLGYDVSQLSATEILNLNKNTSNDSNDSKKSKNSLLKAGNKLSKKVFKTLKKTFRHDKVDSNTTLNPYEVPRKQVKEKTIKKDTGIENPGLNLDNSDDLEIEELSDEEHHYETIKTLRNTKLNMNVTPLKAKENDLDFSHKTNTPSKRVRFDSTLNQEKIITGDSFDFEIQSPGFDAKIDKFHDELENCINERKFLQQNM